MKNKKTLAAESEGDSVRVRRPINRNSRRCGGMRTWSEFGFQSLSRDSQKQGRLGLDAGATREASDLNSMRARKARRQAETAEAFCEPNSIHLGRGH